MAKTLSCETYWAKIFTAGPINEIEQICRSFVLSEGLCVTVTPHKYIYTGGEEVGAEIGLINYPRFPTDADTIKEVALRLAKELMTGMHQGSFTIMTPDETVYHSRRDEFER